MIPATIGPLLSTCVPAKQHHSASPIVWFHGLYLNVDLQLAYACPLVGNAGKGRKLRRRRILNALGVQRDCKVIACAVAVLTVAAVRSADRTLGWRVGMTCSSACLYSMVDIHFAYMVMPNRQMELRRRLYGSLLKVMSVCGPTWQTDLGSGRWMMPTACLTSPSLLGEALGVSQSYTVGFQVLAPPDFPVGFLLLSGPNALGRDDCACWIRFTYQIVPF